MKRVLMVAFQFPPFAGSSAIQRTLRFVQHLPTHGWEAIVLTTTPSAYEETSHDLLASVPPPTIVERAFALDTARHLAIARRYPAFLARPDRWCTWRFTGVSAGERLIRRYRPAAIWSTFPIATAHQIATRLHQRSGLPWLADFRDPMAQKGYPADPLTWRSYKAIEDDAIHRARFAIFTTPGAAKMYRERYPDVTADRVRIVENGYDEESFIAAEAGARIAGALVPNRITLLHSGAAYLPERDPTQFFEALRRLKSRGRIDAARFRVRFRAPGNESMLRTLSAEKSIADLLEILPDIPYRQALEEMIRADALLVLQASSCNQQIPAKLYEYLRSERPVLGLTDPRGDTAAAMQKAGVTTIASLSSVDAIESLLQDTIAAIELGQAPVPDPSAARRSARAARAAELAALLDAVCS
jgi:hypothetical protein